MFHAIEPSKTFSNLTFLYKKGEKESYIINNDTCKNVSNKNKESRGTNNTEKLGIDTSYETSEKTTTLKKNKESDEEVLENITKIFEDLPRERIQINKEIIEKIRRDTEQMEKEWLKKRQLEEQAKQEVKKRKEEEGLKNFRLKNKIFSIVKELRSLREKIDYEKSLLDLEKQIQENSNTTNVTLSSVNIS